LKTLKSGAGHIAERKQLVDAAVHSGEGYLINNFLIKEDKYFYFLIINHGKNLLKEATCYLLSLTLPHVPLTLPRFFVRTAQPRSARTEAMTYLNLFPQQSRHHIRRRSDAQKCTAGGNI
jgi:hypothetical protein